MRPDGECSCCSGRRPGHAGRVSLAAAVPQALQEAWPTDPSHGLRAEGARIAAETEALDRLLRVVGKGRILFRNACILTMDPRIGSFLSGDILIEGDSIVAVGEHIDATAEIIEAAGKIIIPGFVDTHRHCWQNSFRRFAANATLETYGDAVDQISRIIRPEDVYVGNLVSCLGAIDSGVTTMLDWSHVSNTPDHSDAAIAALQASGMRAVYGYGQSRCHHPDSQYPRDVYRIRERYFSSEDQLVTLFIGANIDRAANWKIARELGVRITCHVFHQTDLLEGAYKQGLMGPDITYIHCTDLSDTGWRMIADTGGTYSLAAASIARLGVGGGIPPIQKALNHGIQPSLSVDVEASLTSDFFTPMRTTLAIQRAFANDLRDKGDSEAPALLSVEDVLRFATVEGARANGLDGRVGTITPGKQADLVLLDPNDLSTMPLNHAAGTVVSACDRRNVVAVFVAGRPVKWGGQLVGVDAEAVHRMIVASRDWLVERAGRRLDVLGTALQPAERLN